MIYYKIDILHSLKEFGYSTTRLRNEHVLSEATIQRIRKGENISLESLDKICGLLSCNICDIIAYKEVQ